MRKLFDIEQIRRWDEATIGNGIDSIDLMERAAQGLADSIRARTTKTDCIGILAGTGNNGGDALALARLLKDCGYESVTSYLIRPADRDLSPDCDANAARLVEFILVDSESSCPSPEELGQYDLLIDGLFGSGLSRPLEGIWRQCVESINGSKTPVISIDIPSGAYADRCEKGTTSVKADLVLSLQIPKRTFMYPESARFMKEFAIVDIGLDADFHEREQCDQFYLEAKDALLSRREKFSHKGTYGHALLIGGSNGMYGAVQLSARACLRSGVGLLTMHSGHEAMPILQTAVPEAMFSSDPALDRITEVPDLTKATAVGCGPGLGQDQMTTVFMDGFLKKVNRPLVLDADALNIISREGWQDRIPKGTIITPHPKEFERLFGKSQDNTKAVELQRSMAQKLQIIIIRKGAHSSIALPDGRLMFNSTGNPYMAVGGMGDILTGFILGLLAQGYTAEKAALTGVFLHGLAGDRTLVDRNGAGVSCDGVITRLFN